MNCKLYLFVIILITVRDFVSCDNRNPLGLLDFNKKINIETLGPSLNKNITLETHDLPSGGNNLKKRRTFYSENSDNDFLDNEESFEYGSRRQNYFNGNEKRKLSDNFQEENWENNGSVSAHASELEHLQHSEGVTYTENYKEKSNLNGKYDWEKKGDFYEEKRSRFNDGRNLKHYLNSYSDARDKNNYGRKDSSVISDHRDMRKQKSYNHENELLSSMRSRHHINPKINHNGFQNHDFYNSDKGLVINFNTECPASAPSKNRLVHKFIFAPKSHINAHSEVPSFQIPSNSYLSSQVTPYYYL